MDREQFMDLERRVDHGIFHIRVAFATAAIFLFAMLIINEFYLGMLYFGAVMLVAYHLSFKLLGWYIIWTLPKEGQVTVYDTEKIESINERLIDGTLDADSEEFERLVKESGVVEVSLFLGAGPVIGRQNNKTIYEWVKCKQGVKGEPHNYTWVCEAEFDEHENLNYPNEDGKEYVIVEGMLYERSLEQNAEVSQ